MKRRGIKLPKVASEGGGRVECDEEEPNNRDRLAQVVYVDGPIASYSMAAIWRSPWNITRWPLWTRHLHAMSQLCNSLPLAKCEHRGTALIKLDFAALN